MDKRQMISIPRDEYVDMLRQQKALFATMKNYLKRDRVHEEDNEEKPDKKANNSAKKKAKTDTLDEPCPGRLWLGDGADKTCVGGKRSNEKARIKHDGHLVTICYECKLWRDRQKRANKKVNQD